MNRLEKTYAKLNKANLDLTTIETEIAEFRKKLTPRELALICQYTILSNKRYRLRKRVLALEKRVTDESLKMTPDE